MGSNGPLIGILGGMGPLATAHFMTLLATLSQADRDQDHCRTLVYSNPRLPDRSEALLKRGPSPLAGMIEGLLLLERSGADVIAIPCNTAHVWIDDLIEAARVPLLSIVDAVKTDIAARCGRHRRVAVLGTSGMIGSGLYQRNLQASGYDVLLADEEGHAAIQSAIRAVKAGDIAVARPLILDTVRELGQRGADAVVFGCTELPVAVPEGAAPNGTMLIDSTRCLATACLAWAAEVENAQPVARPPSPAWIGTLEPILRQ